MSGSFRSLLVLCAAAALALVPATTAAAPPAPQAMHVTIGIASVQHDGVVMRSNFAVRAGGAVTLTFVNHTPLFHTFTVPSLGISVLISPARGGTAARTSVTLVVPYGIYRWECELCAAGAHSHMHAMRGTMYAIINT